LDKYHSKFLDRQPAATKLTNSQRQHSNLDTIALRLAKFVLLLVMKNGRNTDGKFSNENAGRPKGSRNKATIAIESLLEGQAEALTQTAISKALEGDSIALRLCMDRIAPPMKDKPVVFPLPKMQDAMDASQAAGSVLSAVSDGTLTPIEGARVMGLIDSYRRALELTDIEQRLHTLETTNAGA